MPVLLYVAGVVAHNDLNQWKKGGFETCVTIKSSILKSVFSIKSQPAQQINGIRARATTYLVDYRAVVKFFIMSMEFEKKPFQIEDMIALITKMDLIFFMRLV